MSRILLILSLALAACGQSPSPSAVQATGEQPQVLEQRLPSSFADRRYVGRWAAAAAGCEAPPWRFETERLTTSGEVACDFLDVDETETGYRIAASCTSEGASAPHTLELSFAENAGAMEVSGGPWNAVALVHCGTL